jgi:hypothetical protein
MQFRYLIVGIALAMLVFSVGLIATGTVKFKAFPDLEGNNLELTDLWQQNTPDLPDVVSIQYKESRVGPAGRAIHIPLSSVAIITEEREYARIGHINHRRTLPVFCACSNTRNRFCTKRCSSFISTAS